MLASRRIVLDICSSTNDVVKEWLSQCGEGHAVAVLSHDQLAGKGQRGRIWYSTPYESLLMSMGFKSFWPANRSVFTFQAVTATTIVQILREATGIPVVIKWPNDVYYRSRKLGGILTEAQCQGQKLWDVIVGLGLNLNQLQFPTELPNPISLRQITGLNYKAEELFHKLCDALELQIFRAREQEDENLLKIYKSLTDGFQSYHTYALIPEGGLFKGRLKEIEDDGKVYIETEEGTQLGPFHHHMLQRLYEADCDSNFF
jgi:BirA family biotin operon repressor/biotin-[acetyl-CoA-carboxylase] ligase